MLALALAMVEGPEEQSKFRVLAARYERLMFHVARQILPNEQDAEDAVQEASPVTAHRAKLPPQFCAGPSTPPRLRRYSNGEQGH